MKRLWPRSLVWHTLLVLLSGVLISNVVGIALYSDDRLDVLTRARDRRIVEQVAAAAAAVGDVSAGERQRLLRTIRQPGLRLSWSERPAVEGTTTGWRGRRIREAFDEQFGELDGDRLRLILAYRLPAPPPPAPPPVDDPGEEGELPGSDDPPPIPAEEHHRPRRGAGVPVAGGAELHVLMGSLRLDVGGWLNFSAPIATVRPFWETPVFFFVVATTAVVLMVSLWAVRRATEPLAMFAEAAERLGRDVDAPPLALEGPREVERAAIAFNDMQDRLRRFVQDRTQMLAAMSHDLRTPLTRLRLRAELIEDEEEQRKTIADLEEMRTMIDSVLSFARDEATAEPPTALDLAALLQTICDEATDAGADASYSGPSRATCIGRPTALKRAFANLIANAVSWGGSARVTLTLVSDGLRVTVDDPGPGIPEAELGRVFEPFHRVESSRNRETGGVGLGLAIVRAAIIAHGGRVRLANLPAGGLRATVDLPSAAKRDAVAGESPTVSLANGRREG